MTNKSLITQLLKESIKGEVTYKGKTYSKEEIKDMRDWLKDVQWADLDSEEVDDLSDEAVLQGVNRNYEGGLKNFRHDNNLSESKEVEVEVPEFVEKELKDKGLSLKDLEKSKVRRSLSAETRHWIQDTMMPSTKSKIEEGSMEAVVCPECGNDMEKGVCSSCGAEHPENKQWGKPDEGGHQASMAKAELRDLVENAAKLHKMIQPGTSIPGWCAAYITLASDYMHSVYEFAAEQSKE